MRHGQSKFSSYYSKQQANYIHFTYHSIQFIVTFTGIWVYNGMNQWGLGKKKNVLLTISLLQQVAKTTVIHKHTLVRPAVNWTEALRLEKQENRNQTLTYTMLPKILGVYFAFCLPPILDINTFETSFASDLAIIQLLISIPLKLILHNSYLFNQKRCTLPPYLKSVSIKLGL